jgi:hypothetical protein
MNQALLKAKAGRDAPPRRGRLPVDKFNARRVELAEAALATLADVGYARTSLREIAQKKSPVHPRRSLDNRQDSL